MNKNVLIVAVAVAVVAVVAVAAFFLLSGPKWDEPLDSWVLNQDVKEGDYIQYNDTYTVVSVNGNTCEVRKNSDTGTITMSKQDFLRLLSAKEQMARLFSGSNYTISAHYDKEDSFGSLRNFEGEVRTNSYGIMEDYDLEMYIGPHNILQSWDIEDFRSGNLRTNLPFINF